MGTLLKHLTTLNGTTKRKPLMMLDGTMFNPIKNIWYHKWDNKSETIENTWWKPLHMLHHVMHTMHTMETQTNKAPMWSLNEEWKIPILISDDTKWDPKKDTWRNYKQYCTMYCWSVSIKLYFRSILDKTQVECNNPIKTYNDKNGTPNRKLSRWIDGTQNNYCTM